MLGSTWRLPGVCPVLPHLGGKPWGSSSDSWPVMASLPESCGQRLGPRGLDPSAIWLSVISAPPWSVYLPWDKHFPPHLAKISIRSSKIEPRQLHTARGCRLRRPHAKLVIWGFAQRWEDVGRLETEARVHGRPLWALGRDVLSRSRQRAPHPFTAPLASLPDFRGSGKWVAVPSRFSQSPFYKLLTGIKVASWGA